MKPIVNPHNIYNVYAGLICAEKVQGERSYKNCSPFLCTFFKNAKTISRNRSTICKAH
jgi:hypothetical protein